tara:strand:- start:653 stop:1285 length:633 start_codon:yes stop_codon:yes gene_type:complete
MEIFMENRANKLRREDKYVSNLSSYNRLKKTIIKEGFRKAHASNYINNIYYDHDDFSYSENVEGETYRTKYRLRWYDYKDEYILEIKKKNGKSGYKIRNKIKAANRVELEKKINKILPPNFKSVIKNRYFREYFVKDDVRITMDSRLRFSNLKSDKYRFFNKIIIEIKYPKLSEFDFDLVKRLNLTYTKFSKFAKGLEYLRNNPSLISCS